MQKSVVFVSSKLGEGSRLSSAGHAGVPGLVRPVEFLLQLPLRGARGGLRPRLRAGGATLGAPARARLFAKLDLTPSWTGFSSNYLTCI